MGRVSKTLEGMANKVGRKSGVLGLGSQVKKVFQGEGSDALSQMWPTGQVRRSLVAQHGGHW